MPHSPANDDDDDDVISEEHELYQTSNHVVIHNGANSLLVRIHNTKQRDAVTPRKVHQCRSTDFIEYTYLAQSISYWHQVDESVSSFRTSNKTQELFTPSFSFSLLIVCVEIKGSLKKYTHWVLRWEILTERLSASKYAAMPSYFWYGMCVWYRVKVWW